MMKTYKKIRFDEIQASSELTDNEQFLLEYVNELRISNQNTYDNMQTQIYNLQNEVYDLYNELNDINENGL